MTAGFPEDILYRHFFQNHTADIERQLCRNIIDDTDIHKLNTAQSLIDILQGAHIDKDDYFLTAFFPL